MQLHLTPRLLDADEYEDTQPSVALPLYDEELAEADTRPDFKLPLAPLYDGHWEHVLRAVAEAIRRVLATAGRCGGAERRGET